MPRSPLSRRAVMRLAAVAWAGSLAPDSRSQAVFPQPGRPIRLLVGLAPGGALDTQARTLARRLSELARVPVMVENRPGASTMLAAQELMRSAPDGHTLLYSPSTLFAQNPHTLAHVPYDPFTDFTPIGLVARGPLVLTAHASLPAQSVGELIAWARAHPGELNFANFGTGTSSHVYAAAFARVAGIEVVHVPYKGAAEAMRDFLEGRVQAFFDAAPAAIQSARTGRVRMLAVAAPARSPAMPQVPTFDELGLPGLDLTSWTALVGPAAMPGELVARINALLVQTLQSPEVDSAIAAGAYEASPGTPAQLASEIRSAHARWGSLIQRLGMPRQ